MSASLAANPQAAGSNGTYFQGNMTGLNYSPGTSVPTSYTQSSAYSPPDYASLIQSDPGYLQLQQALSASGISTAAQRAAATQRALIQFGLVPDFNASAQSLGLSPQALGFLQTDVTPEAHRLAELNTQNGLSTEARLNQAHSRAIMQLRNALAARGALSSGEAPYQLNQQELSYQQSQSDLVNRLLDTILGAQGSYLSNQQQAQSQLTQGLQDAYSRALQAYAAGGYGGGGGYAPPQQTSTVPQPPQMPETLPPPTSGSAPVPIPSVAQAIQNPNAQRGQLARINSVM